MAASISQSSIHAFFMRYTLAYSLASKAIRASGIKITCMMSSAGPCVSGSS